MKKIIKHNLSLLRKIHLRHIFFVVMIFLLFIKDAFGTFLMTVPTMTFLAALTIEAFDENKYNIIFSLPVTRTEFAKAKFLTLLIIYGAVAVLTLGIYTFKVITGITKAMPVSILILELSLTFPISIIFSGIYVAYSSKLPSAYLLIMSIIIANIDIPLDINENIILVALITLILLAVCRFVYVITKENFIRIYTEKEL